MSRNGQDKLFEGWLTKSPPIKRIWRGVNTINLFSIIFLFASNFFLSDGENGGSRYNNPEICQVNMC